MKNRLKELRTNNEVTLSELSIFIERHGLKVTDGQLSLFENNKRKLRNERIYDALADYFGVSVPYLLGYVDKNEKVEHDSNFVQITTAEFDDLWNARQELHDFKLALRILKNAMGFSTKEENEDDL